jgi:hypothetical protein
VVDARLVTPPPGLEPFQNVGIQPDRKLLFDGRPRHRRLPKERLAEVWDVGVIDIGIVHAVNSLQVACNRFLAQVGSPGEHLLGVPKIQAVFGEVAAILRLVPFVPYLCL